MEYREFRAESVVTDENGRLDGLVTPFNRETVIGDMERGGWREEVANGAFSKTLREGDALMVYQHDLTRPLARKSAGNLELRETGDGLAVNAQPVDTSYARDLRTLVKAKVIQGMSFGFNVVKDEWRDDQGNPSTRLTGTHRILREVKLIEVSPVTRPAYGGTSIMARDEASALLEERAPKATYADTATCGECGATSQYGAFCTGCGGSMRDDKPSGDYCGSCGGKIPSGKRDEHVCDETRASSKPYGNVPYADSKNGKYPIDKEHVKAAWSYINQAKNAAKYPLNGVSLESVKAKIKAAMKKFGFTSGSAGEAKNFEFVSPEWRDDDPFYDPFYEIDDVEVDEGDTEEPLAADKQRAQEPDASTPEDDESELALSMANRAVEFDCFDLALSLSRKSVHVEV